MAGQLRTTKLLAYVELQAQPAVKVTQVTAYVELSPQPALKVTKLYAYAELEPVAADQVSQAFVYVEEDPNSPTLETQAVWGYVEEAISPNLVEVAQFVTYVEFGEAGDWLPFSARAAAASSTAAGEIVEAEADTYQLHAHAAAASSTPAGVLSLQLPLHSQAAAASQTPAPMLTWHVALGASAAAVTATANGTLISAVLLTAQPHATSATPAAGITVVRALLAAAAAASSTPTVALAVFRRLAVHAAARSRTRVPGLSTLGTITALATAVSATNAPTLRTPTLLQAQTAAASVTATIEFARIVHLAAAAPAASATATAALGVWRVLHTAAPAASVTVAARLDRRLPQTATVLAASQTATPLLNRLRRLAALAASGSATPDQALIILHHAQATVVAASATAEAALQSRIALVAAIDVQSASAAALLVRHSAQHAIGAAACTTPDATLWSMRAYAATLLAASATPDAALLTLRHTRARVLSGTTLPDVELARFMSLHAAADARSATDPVSVLPAGVILATAGQSQSATADAALDVARRLVAAPPAASMTATPLLARIVALQAHTAAASRTSSGQIITARALSAQVAAYSAVAPDVRLAWRWLATVQAVSATASAALPLSCALAGSGRAESVTAAPDLTVTVVVHALAAHAAAVSHTPALPPLHLPPPLRARALVQSATPAPSLRWRMVTRTLAASATPDAMLAVQRPLTGHALAASLTSQPWIFLSADGQMTVTHVGAYLETTRRFIWRDLQLSALLAYIEQRPASAAILSALLGLVEQRPAPRLELSSLLGYAELRPDPRVRSTAVRGVVEVKPPDRVRATRVAGYVELQAADGTLRATQMLAYAEVEVPFVLVGTSYYVRQSGSDVADGLTPSSAFRTIGKAMSVAVGGDTVYIGAGWYEEALVLPHSGVRGGPITLHGDFTGERTGDPGFVMVSTQGVGGDRSGTANYLLLDSNGQQFWTFRQIHFLPGGDRGLVTGQVEGFIWLRGTNTAHEGLLFEDCVFPLAPFSSAAYQVRIDYLGTPQTPVTHGPTFRRCVFSQAGIYAHLGIFAPRRPDQEPNLKIKLEACLCIGGYLDFDFISGGSGYAWGGVDLLSCTFVTACFFLLDGADLSSTYPVRMANCVIFQSEGYLVGGFDWGDNLIDLGGNYWTGHVHNPSWQDFGFNLPVLLGGIADWPLRRIWGASPWRPWEPLIVNENLSSGHLHTNPAYLPAQDLYGEPRHQGGGLVQIQFGTNVTSSDRWGNEQNIISGSWSDWGNSSTYEALIQVTGVPKLGELGDYPIEEVLLGVSFTSSSSYDSSPQLGVQVRLDSALLVDARLQAEQNSGQGQTLARLPLPTPSGGWTRERLGNLAVSLWKASDISGSVYVHMLELGIRYATGVTASGAVFARAQRGQERYRVRDGKGAAITLHGAGSYVTQRSLRANACTVSVWVKADSAYNGAPPQLVVELPQTGQLLVRSMTVAAEVWEELSVSFTPEQAGPLVVRLVSYDSSNVGQVTFDNLTVMQGWL